MCFSKRYLAKVAFQCVFKIHSVKYYLHFGESFSLRGLYIFPNTFPKNIQQPYCPFFFSFLFLSIFPFFFLLQGLFTKISQKSLNQNSIYFEQMDFVFRSILCIFLKLSQMQPKKPHCCNVMSPVSAYQQNDYVLIMKGTPPIISFDQWKINMSYS